jgi:hypothetical protein
MENELAEACLTIRSTMNAGRSKMLLAVLQAF